jgi:hypothetical protein
MPAAKAIPDTYTFIIAAAVGLLVGAILSFLFGRFTLPTKIPSEFTIGGLPSGVVVTNLVLMGIVAAVVFLAYASYVVQDTTFPTQQPWLFLIETLVVAFVPASVIYVILDFRHDGRLELSTLNLDFILLAAKFGIFHLLFQFSGLYTYLVNA